MNATSRFCIKNLLIVLFIVGNVVFVRGESETQQGYLGVWIQTLSEEKKEALDISHGVDVVRLLEDGPADQAGILEGDVILDFNGKEIADSDHLSDVVRGTKPKTEVKVTLLRDDEEKQIVVEVGQYRSDDRYEWMRDGNVLRFYSGRQVYLGVTLQNMNADLAEYFGVREGEGLLILDIQEDSPAEKAGLKTGDVIIALGDVVINDSEDIQDVLADFDEGDQITVEIIRHKQRQDIPVELEENPDRTIRIYRPFDNLYLPNRFEWEGVMPRVEEFQFNGEELEFRMQEMKERIEESRKKLEDINIQIKLKLENIPRWI